MRRRVEEWRGEKQAIWCRSDARADEELLIGQICTSLMHVLLRVRLHGCTPAPPCKCGRAGRGTEKQRCRRSVAERWGAR